MSLAAPFVGGTGFWRQEFTGVDSDAGYNTASAAFPGGASGTGFYYTVRGTETLANYVISSIASKELTMRVLATDPGAPDLSRNQFSWFNSDGNILGNAGVYQILRLQSNLATIMPNDGGDYFRMFAEMREVDDASRVTFSIQRYANSAALVWRVRFQHAPFVADQNVQWEHLISEATFPIPVGTSAIFSIDWVAANGPEGRARLKVNGTTLVDHRGPTTKTGRLQHVDVMKCYTGEASLLIAEANQVVELLELWTGEPYSGVFNVADRRGIQRVVDVGALPDDLAANASYALTRNGPSGKVDTITKTIGGQRFRMTLAYTGDNLTSVSEWILQP